MIQQSLNRFNQLLGIRVEREDDTGCVATMEIRPEHWNSIEGVIHGGVTSTLADVAMGFGAAPHVNGVQQSVTVESKIHYLRPARGSRLTAKSQVLKSGKKLIIMEAKVMDEEGNLVAVATGTYARIGS
jgi:uncharacterized protein (TIGR00369 family)